jgi:hypothetical protein
MSALLYAAANPVPAPLIGLFAVVFISAIVWNVMAGSLFSRLKNDHPSIYERLRCPSIFIRRGNTWLFLKFLLCQEWRSLDDPDLQVLAGRLRILFFCHLALFVPLMVWTLLLCKW